MSQPDRPENKPVLLIVDDTPGNLRLAGALLRDLYNVRVASSGEAALKLLDGGLHPDLILLDVVMEGMSGYDACRLIRENPVTASIPVLFLTGMDDQDSYITGLSAGAADFVAKPICPPQLLIRVRQQIEMQELRRQLAATRQELADLRAGNG